MKQFNRKVFDHTIDSSAFSYTSIYWNDIFGVSDSIVIGAVARDVSGGRALTIAIEHSMDGVKWIQKNAAPEISGVAFGSSETAICGADKSKAPSAKYVRLRMSLGAGSARVKVYATIRDRSNASTGLSMTMAMIAARLRAEVMGEIAFFGKSIKQLDSAVHDELWGLFNGAIWNRPGEKVAGPSAPSPALIAGHKPAVVEGIYQLSPSGRLSYVFERLSPRAKAALQPLVPIFKKFMRTVAAELARDAAALFGIHADLKALAALAFKNSPFGAGAAQRPKRPVQVGEVKSELDAGFQDWSEDSARVGFAAVDDFEEAPWEDGMEPYSASEGKNDVRFWRGSTLHRGQLSTGGHGGQQSPSAASSAHGEVDALLRGLSPRVDSSIFEFIYKLLAPAPLPPPDTAWYQQLVVDAKKCPDKYL